MIHFIHIVCFFICCPVSNCLTPLFSAQHTKYKLALQVVHVHAQIQRYTRKILKQQTALIFFPFLYHTYFIKLHAECLLIYGNCQQKQKMATILTLQYRGFNWDKIKMFRGGKNLHNTLSHWDLHPWDVANFLFYFIVFVVCRSRCQQQHLTYRTPPVLSQHAHGLEDLE